MRGTSAGNGSYLVKKGLVLWGCAAVSLALTAQAIAQSTTLPQVTVEGKGTTAKKGTAKGAPKAAPQQPAEPVQQVETQAAKEKAQKEAVYNTPAAVSTATKSEIDTFGQVDTGNIVRSMPGTYTRESIGNPGIGVNIRGLEGSGRVNMMIDGVRQNFRFTGHEAQGFVYVDPALLAGVDIARGAISTVGGAGSLVGAANFRTLDIDDILKPGKSSGGITSLTWGSNGQGWSEMGAGAMRAGNFGFAAALSHREPDNYENGAGRVIPYTQQDMLSGLVKGEVKFSPDAKLSLGGVFYHNDFVAQSIDQDVDSQVFTAKYRYAPKDNPLVDFRLNLSYSDVQMSYGRAVVATPASVINSQGRRINDKGYGVDATNISRFALSGGVRVKAEYGVEYYFDDVNAWNVRDPSQGGNVNPGGESTVAGVFSQTTFSAGIFDLIAGLRYDVYKLDGSFTANATNAFPLQLTPGVTYALDQSEGRLDPKVTLAAKVAPWLQPYITYSESMRAPTINETMAGGSHQNGTVNFSPNPFLKPEIQRGWEFGANVVQDGLFARGDSFRLKANYFTMEVENYITSCFTAGFSAYFCNSPGKSNVQGVEVQGMYDARTIFAGLSYTYTDSDLSTQTNGFGAQSYLPDHILVLTGGLRFMEQKLTVGARYTVTSSAYTGSDATAVPNAFNGPIRTDGYQLLDLYTSYKFDSGLELGATVSNVFDVAYMPALATPPTTTSCGTPPLSAACQTGMGRTVLLTAKTQF